MNQVTNFIKEYSNFIVFVLFIISFCLMFYTNQYDMVNKTIEVVKNGSVKEQTIWYLSNQTVGLNIIAIIFLNTAVALFISSFFLRYIEKSEKESFYNKLQEFQKETAKDAIKATFERVIDNDLFSIIKQDILNANFLRRNVQWDFDIYKNDEEKLELKRTLTYHLKNITTKDQEETFTILSSDNHIHSSLKFESCKYKETNEKEYKILNFDNKNSRNNTLEISDKIDIKANSEVQVVIVFTTISMSDYLYETHSTRFPIVGLSLTVNYPREYDFEIVVQSLSNELEETSVSEGKKKYETKKAIYKGQGIEFMCYKKDDNEKNE